MKVKGHIIALLAFAFVFLNSKAQEQISSDSLVQDGIVRVLAIGNSRRIDWQPCHGFARGIGIGLRTPGAPTITNHHPLD